MSNLFNDVRIYPFPQLQFRSLTSTALQSNTYNEVDEASTSL